MGIGVEGNMKERAENGKRNGGEGVSDG